MNWFWSAVQGWGEVVACVTAIGLCLLGWGVYRLGKLLFTKLSMKLSQLRGKPVLTVAR